MYVLYINVCCLSQLFSHEQYFVARIKTTSEFLETYVFSFLNTLRGINMFDVVKTCLLSEYTSKLYPGGIKS